MELELWELLLSIKERSGQKDGITEIEGIACQAILPSKSSLK
jgi:hypothetical protein